MYHFSELGLQNIRTMCQQAYQEEFAVPALNFVSIEQFNAIIDAMIAKRSPVMLLASPNLHRQLGAEMMARISQSGADRLIHEGAGAVPLALHLDHGMTFDQCVQAIDTGFSSVMIDGSALPFDQNIALTQRVVEYAHQYDVTVEGELGVLAGVEEENGENYANESQYTDPSMVETFVEETGVDCLAISIGTSHGLVKMKPKADGSLPELRFDILHEIQRRVWGFPIVLHGSSAIPRKYVDMINDYGGQLEETTGIPDEQVSKAAKMAVCKVNIASDGWISALALTRKILAENPAAIDSRVFTLKVRPELAALYEHKMDVLGSSGRA